MIDKLKKVKWWTLIGLFFLIGYFHQNLLLFIYQQGIQAYTLANFGCKLQYEKAYVKGHRLVLISPYLPCENSFKANQMAFSWRLNLKNLEINISIELEKPAWLLDPHQTFNEDKLQKVFHHKKKGIKYFFDITIHDGTLTWLLPNQQSRTLHFDVRTNNYSGGIIKAYFEQLAESPRYISIKTTSSSDLLAIVGECHEVECTQLMPFLKLFFPSLSDIHMTTGQLSGLVKINFPYTQRPYTEGEINLKNATFWHKDSFEAHLEESRLKLNKNPNSNELLSTLTTFELVKPMALICHQATNATWKIQQLLGHLNLDGNKKAALQMHFQGHHLDHTNQFKLEGQANLDAKQAFNVDLNLDCSSASSPNGNIRLTVSQIDKQKKAEIELQQLSFEEAGFLQTVLASLWPSISNIKVHQGFFNGKMEMSITKEGMQNFEIKQLEASKVHFTHQSMEATGSFDHMRMNGLVRLAEKNPWDTLNMEFHLDNGAWQLKGVNQRFPLTNIQAHLILQKGALDHSLITLDWMGLKGRMDLEWGQTKELLSIHLDGHVHDIANLFPLKVQAGLQQEFPHSALKILANFKRHHQNFELTGTINIQRNQTDQFDLIHFGCEFSKPPPSHNRWVPTGWLYAYNLPLEKFVSPFIFRQGILKMSGNGEFKGIFNNQLFTLQYDVQNLKIENDDLLITVADLRSQVPGQLLGFHQMDLHTFSHQGHLPIKEATYYEKNSGLLFKNTQGTFQFKDETLTISPIETYCQGVFLGGKIFLDYRDPAPGVFSVKINASQVTGKLSQIRSILSCLKTPSLLNSLPLEGDVHARNQGMRLVFDFIPRDYSLQANIQASLSDGFMTLQENDLALKGLFLDIDYCHDQECLNISDIQGAVLVGKPVRVEEYLLEGNFIRLKNLTRQNIDFDFCLKDPTKELLRFHGHIQEIKPGIKEVFLRPSSHISCIYPRFFNCQLEDWTKLKNFVFKSQFSLNTLIQDLLKFKNTGLCGLSSHFLNQMAQLDSLDGNIQLEVSLDEKTGYLNYRMEGHQIKNHASNDTHHCLLKAQKGEKKWIIDHLEWDKWTAHAEIQPEEGKWKIPFLCLKDEEALLLGLEGDFFPEQNYMQAKINLCEVSLADLEKWPFLSPFISFWQPVGKMRGTGTIKINFLSHHPWCKCDLSLNADLARFNCRKSSFYLTKPITIDYKADNCITIKNVHLNLCQENKQSTAHVMIPSLRYNLNEPRLVCSKLNFQIPVYHLSKITENLTQHFPEWIDKQWMQKVVQLKKEGEIKGSVSFDKREEDTQFTFQLDDSLYSINQQLYPLKQLEINQAQHILNFSVLTQKENCPYRLVGKMSWPALDRGEVTLVDLTTPLAEGKNPLKIQFSQDNNGFLANTMHGYFCGMNIHLHGGKRDLAKPELFHLQGKIEVDFNDLARLLETSQAEKIYDLELDSTFHFKGNYAYHLHPTYEFSDCLYFKGEMTSQEAVIKGIQVEKVKANLNYRPQQLEVSAFTIQDAAGNVQAEKIIVTQNEPTKAWWFSLPTLSVKNLKPSLLREIKEPSSPSTRFKTLWIKRLDFLDIQGNIEETKTWKAKGSLYFLNSSGRNVTHPLLAIPAEIILRLGLNPQVLNPVSGTLFFDVKGDRFYLTRFKDVYSEGRGSKFYLADSPTPSWMDMKGNLNVQFKMKQYNLLFKLAELFTVSMEGHIKKPQFSLQKHKSNRKLPAISAE